MRVLHMSDPFWSKLWNTNVDSFNKLELKEANGEEKGSLSEKEEKQETLEMNLVK